MVKRVSTTSYSIKGKEFTIKELIKKHKTFYLMERQLFPEYIPEYIGWVSLEEIGVVHPVLRKAFKQAVRINFDHNSTYGTDSPYYYVYTSKSIETFIYPLLSFKTIFEKMKRCHT